MKGKATTSSLHRGMMENDAQETLNNHLPSSISLTSYLNKILNQQIVSNENELSITMPQQHSHQLARDAVLVRGERKSEFLHNPIDGRPVHGCKASSNAERGLLIASYIDIFRVIMPVGNS